MKKLYTISTEEFLKYIKDISDYDNYDYVGELNSEDLKDIKELNVCKIEEKGISTEYVIFVKDKDIFEIDKLDLFAKNHLLTLIKDK